VAVWIGLGSAGVPIASMGRDQGLKKGDECSCVSRGNHFVALEFGGKSMHNSIFHGGPVGARKENGVERDFARVGERCVERNTRMLSTQPFPIDAKSAIFVHDCKVGIT
jgi:hypothetical protein